jgi:hypothetical protein
MIRYPILVDYIKKMLISDPRERIDFTTLISRLRDEESK